MPEVTATLTRRAGMAWGVLLGIVLALLGAAVNQGALRFSDQLLLLIAQAPANHPLDVAMVLVSGVASVEVSSVLMLGLVLTTRARAELGLQRWVPLVIFGLLNLVELGAKTMIRQPPPPDQFLRVRHLPGLFLRTAGAFPSGHMTRITLVVGLLALRLALHTRRGFWLWLGVAAVWTIGFSRVYLGEHWPADVAGGILLGGIGLALGLVVAPRGSVGDPDRPAG